MKKYSYIDELDKNIFPFIECEGYDDRYPALTIMNKSASFYQELRYASTELLHIFAKAVTVFQKCPDDFMQLMDIPEKLFPYLDIPNKLNLPTYLSRLDFVLDGNNQLKCVEINADTPCAVIEAYYANAIAADYIHKRNPNESSNKQLRMLLRKITGCQSQFNYRPGFGKIESRPFVFSCFDDYIEDLSTTNYIMSQLDSDIDAEFVSFYDLAVNDRGILLPDSRYAGILYRLHPLELLIEETAPDGYALGTKMLDLYKENKYTMFNPPESIIIQSKGFQALVWALYESHEFFTDIERSIIEKYMIPSYFEDNKEKLSGFSYIRKPIWGREGNNIELYNYFGTLIENKTLNTYNEVVERQSNAYLYQKFIESQTESIETDSGMQSGYMTYSCFMTGEEASAVYSRFSPDKICGIESYWVPLVEI